MRFELHILGSGSALPTSNRNTTAQALNVLERFFLLDCGEATQIQLRKHKLSFNKINYILISHLHGDHFFGLFGLLSSMALLGRKNKLTIFAPTQLKSIILSTLNIQNINTYFPIEFISLNYNSPEIIFQDKKLEVTSIPLKHSIPTCGFLFREKARQRKIKKELIHTYNLSIAEINKLKNGFDITRNNEIIPNEKLTFESLKPRSYAYFTDTVVSRKYIDLIKNVDVLYHESTYVETDKKLARQTAHSTALQVAKFAKDVNCSKLLLGHFSSRYTDDSIFELEAKTIFPNTTAINDGDKITWRNNETDEFLSFNQSNS